MQGEAKVGALMGLVVGAVMRMVMGVEQRALQGPCEEGSGGAMCTFRSLRHGWRTEEMEVLQ